MKKLKTLSIDRSKWAVPNNMKRRVGLKDLNSALLVVKWDPRTGELESTGMKCCLGFLAEACGVQNQWMMDQAYPGDLTSRERQKISEDYIYGKDKDKNTRDDERFQHRAAALNDDNLIRPLKREERLKKLFSEVGIKLSFRGKYL